MQSGAGFWAYGPTATAATTTTAAATGPPTRPTGPPPPQATTASHHRKPLGRRSTSVTQATHVTHDPDQNFIQVTIQTLSRRSGTRQQSTRQPALFRQSVLPHRMNVRDPLTFPTARIPKRKIDGNATQLSRFHHESSLIIRYTDSRPGNSPAEPPSPI